jgi:polyisoprenoid-binding protein YceI
VIDRTRYGLNWNAPLPKGGVALADDVKLTVELELAREEA